MWNHKIAHTSCILEDIEHIGPFFPKNGSRGLKSRYLKITKNQSTSSKNMLKSWNLAKLGKKMVQKKLPNHFFRFCIFWVKNLLCMVQMAILKHTWIFLKVVGFCWKFVIWVIWWCWFHFDVILTPKSCCDPLGGPGGFCTQKLLFG